MAEGTGAVKACARRHALRALVLLPLALALLAAFGFAGVRWGGAHAGRTPDEVFTYLQRRLGDYPTLEVAALPVLEGARRWLGWPDGVEADLPFIVPPVLPDPARGAPLSSTGGADRRVIRVGPGRAISRIGVAARLAVGGSVIEIDPGDYVADVAL